MIFVRVREDEGVERVVAFQEPFLVDDVVYPLALRVVQRRLILVRVIALRVPPRSPAINHHGLAVRERDHRAVALPHRDESYVEVAVVACRRHVPSPSLFGLKKPS